MYGIVRKEPEMPIFQGREVELEQLRRNCKGNDAVQRAVCVMKEIHWAKNFPNGDSHISHYLAILQVMKEEMKITDWITLVIGLFQGAAEDGGGLVTSYAFEEDPMCGGRNVAFAIEMLTRGTWKEHVIGGEGVHFPESGMNRQKIPIEEYFARIGNLETIALERGFSQQEAKDIADSIRTALCAKRVAVLRRIRTWEASLQRAYLGMTRILLGILRPCPGSDLLQSEYEKQVARMKA